MFLKCPYALHSNKNTINDARLFTWLVPNLADM